jgi:hypothetical protein
MNFCFLWLFMKHIVYSLYRPALCILFIKYCIYRLHDASLHHYRDLFLKLQ